jgi:hypothetical protein
MRQAVITAKRFETGNNTLRPAHQADQHAEEREFKTHYFIRIIMRI